MASRLKTCSRPFGTPLMSWRLRTFASRRSWPNFFWMRTYTRMTRLAHRVEQLPAYIFAEISRKIAEKRAQGVDVVSFGIGDPDLPTPDHIIEALTEAARDPANHRYPESEGLPELREAIARWYERRFGVDLDPQAEVLPLIGSKEGIGHIALCFIDPGDVALVPDPGYPVYAVGTVLAGGEPYYLPLTEENDFLPDLY